MSTEITEGHVSVLDPLNISSQLDDLRSLKDGWMEGGGSAPSQAGLDWLDDRFEELYPCNLPPPYIYPTYDGGVQAEWSLGAREVSLSVNLLDHSAEWVSVDISIEDEDEATLNLDEAADWGWLAVEIGRLRTYSE